MKIKIKKKNSTFKMEREFDSKVELCEWLLQKYENTLFDADTTESVINKILKAKNKKYNSEYNSVSLTEIYSAFWSIYDFEFGKGGEKNE